MTCDGNGLCIVAPVSACELCEDCDGCCSAGYCDGMNTTCNAAPGPLFVGNDCSAAGDVLCQSGTCDATTGKCTGSSFGEDESPDACDQVTFGSSAQPECFDSGRCVNTTSIHNVTNTTADGQCDTQCLFDENFVFPALEGSRVGVFGIGTVRALTIDASACSQASNGIDDCTTSACFCDTPATGCVVSFGTDATCSINVQVRGVRVRVRRDR
jgi:hypothetical protein